MLTEFKKLENYLLSKSKDLENNNLDKFNLAYDFLRKFEDKENIKQIIDIANICAYEIGLGSSSIISTLLSRLFEKYLNKDFLHENFSNEIYEIIYSLNKIDNCNEFSNIKNFIVEISKDIRIVLIKLSEYLYNIRVQKFFTNDRLKKLHELKYIYLPISKRLGLVKLNSEIEDCCLKCSYPRIYYKIVEKLKLKKIQRDELLNRFIEPLENKLHEENFKFQILRRTKSIASIWNKIKHRNIPFEEVYDLSALRIVVDGQDTIEKEKEICWKIFNIIKSIYKLKNDRIRDWITTPKKNGYEALHLTVLNKEHYWAEIQIKTTRMHLNAEEGPAAHWRYKGINFNFVTGFNEWVDDIKSFLRDGVFYDIEDNKHDLLSFSKNNLLIIDDNQKIHKVSNPSTLIDFAFSVSSNNAINYDKGKVNNNNVNLDYILKHGDRVKLFFTETPRIDKDWLKIVKTAKAKDKISKFLRVKNL